MLFGVLYLFSYKKIHEIKDWISYYHILYFILGFHYFVCWRQKQTTFDKAKTSTIGNFHAENWFYGSGIKKHIQEKAERSHFLFGFFFF